LIGIILTPPDRTSSRPAVSKYEDAAGAGDDAAPVVGGAAEHAPVAITTISHTVTRFMQPAFLARDIYFINSASFALTASPQMS
jgi:hypothetical protein